jgi:hypothetical protein
MKDISEMRKSFEAWAVTALGGSYFTMSKGIEYDNHIVQAALEGFQAAYTPRPDVMVVAGAIRKAAKDEQVCLMSEIDAEHIAQAAIDTIFNRKG